MSYLGEIGVTSRIYALYRSERMADLDVAGFQYLYILRVSENPGISQDSLAKLLLFNRSNVTRQVAQLEEKGFLRRERSEEDKRTFLIYPTEKALAVVPRIRQVSLDFRRELTADLSAAEKARLEELEVLLHKANRKGREVIK